MRWNALSAWRSLRLRLRASLKAASPSKALSPWLTKRPLKLGERGECAAKRHLRRKGHRILHTNYRCKLGELDIVSERAGRIVFTEVKALVESAGHRPADHVHPRKIAKIQQLAQFYLRQNRLEGKPVQFDVVEVVFPEGGKRKPRINHIERAF